jgi:hypothetical protein
VKSVSVGARKAPGGIVDVSHGSTGAALTVTLAAAGGALSGTVQSADGPVSEVMVGLFPEEPDGLDRLRTAVSGVGGKYRLESVPLGRYKVFAFDRADLERWQRGEGLDWYETGIETVTVADPAAVQEVRLLTPSS